MKKEIPILFSTPMVQAILAGRKTQTRRIIKPQPRKLERGMIPAPVAIHPDDFEWPNKGSWRTTTVSCKKDGPTGWVEENSRWKRGDILWVRESWSINGFGEIAFKADGDEFKDGDGFTWIPKWKPSIHMSKVAARIWLEVTDIRVERLKDISNEDSLTEGIQTFTKDGNTLKYGLENWNWSYTTPGTGPTMEGKPWNAFANLWTEVNGNGSWDANPWVWVISFKVLSTTGKPALEHEKENVYFVL